MMPKTSMMTILLSVLVKGISQGTSSSLGS
jgi:hypothetical protein